jgi:hypothetical protein
MRNVSDKTSRENQNTRFMFNNFSSENHALFENVEKYVTARQATNDNTWRRKAAVFAADNKGKNTDTH